MGEGSSPGEKAIYIALWSFRLGAKLGYSLWHLDDVGRVGKHNSSELDIKYSLVYDLRICLGAAYVELDGEEIPT